MPGPGRGNDGRLPGDGSLGGMGAEEHLAAQSEPGDPAALTGRLFRDMTGALELLTVYLGERLGLYQALSAIGRRPPRNWPAGRAPPSDISGNGWNTMPLAGCWRSMIRRLSRWLGSVPAAGARACSRRHRRCPLPGVQRCRDSPRRALDAPGGRGRPQRRCAASAAVGTGRAGRNSTGPYSSTCWRGNDSQAIAEVDLRLRSEPPAQVADLACGTGWSSSSPWRRPTR